MTGKVLFALLATISAAFIIWPFFTPLILGVSIGILIYPLHAFLLRKLRCNEIVSGIFVTIGATVLVIAPTAALITSGIRVFLTEIQGLGYGYNFNRVQEKLLQGPWVQKSLLKLSKLLQMQVPDLVDSVRTALISAGAWLSSESADLLGRIPSKTMAGVILVLTIYFSLVDGVRIQRFIQHHSPFSERKTLQILNTFAGLARTVLLASFVSGAAQSVVYMIGLAWSGTSQVLMFGVIVFFGSFIPVVGAAPFTYGVAIYEFLSGDTQTDGIILFIFATLTTVIDQVTRPVFLRGQTNLHPLVALVSLFGGIHLFGAAGVFLGPLLFGLSIEILDAYVESREET